MSSVDDPIAIVSQAKVDWMRVNWRRSKSFEMLCMYSADVIHEMVDDTIDVLMHIEQFDCVTGPLQFIVSRLRQEFYEVWMHFT